MISKTEQKRCNGCGTKLAEPTPEVCPGCQQAIATVGIWTEMTAWRQIRRQGKTRYLLKATLIPAGTTAITWVIYREWRQLPLDTFEFFLAVLSTAFVSFAIAWYVWQYNESLWRSSKVVESNNAR